MALELSLAGDRWSGLQQNSRDFLLRPLQIALRLLRSSHAVGKVAPRLRQTSSRLSLQGEEFAVLSIEFARP